MPALITTEQKVGVSVAFRTAAGNPARVDGVPAWASSDESVAVVVPAPDGLSAEIMSVGPGVATISCEADADLGEGVRSLSTSDDVAVVEASAEAAAFVFGDPVLK